MLSQEKLIAKFLAEHHDGLIEVALNSTTVALPEIRYRGAADRQKYDILQSVRTLTLLHEPHLDQRQGDFHFLSPADAGVAYTPTALTATLDIANRCEFEFEFNHLRFPRFTPADGSHHESLTPARI